MIKKFYYTFFSSMRKLCTLALVSLLLWSTALSASENPTISGNGIVKTIGIWQNGGRIDGDSSELATATISLNPTAVAGLSVEPDSVPSLGVIGAIVMIVIVTLLSMLFARREEKKINYTIRRI